MIDKVTLRKEIIRYSLDFNITTVCSSESFRPLTGIMHSKHANAVNSKSKATGLFPSPYGDNAFKTAKEAELEAKLAIMFPSPYGDNAFKTCPIIGSSFAVVLSFRPLTGIMHSKHNIKKRLYHFKSKYSFRPLTGIMHSKLLYS